MVELSVHHRRVTFQTSHRMFQNQSILAALTEQPSTLGIVVSLFQSICLIFLLLLLFFNAVYLTPDFFGINYFASTLYNDIKRTICLSFLYIVNQHSVHLQMLVVWNPDGSLHEDSEYH